MLGGRAELGHGDDPASDQASDFEALYQAELPNLMRYLRRKVGGVEEATDLAHDSFLKFLRSAPVAFIRTPEAYLRRIATNLLRDRADGFANRLERSAVPIEEGWVVSSGIDQHRELEGRQELARVEHMLAGLKPLTRQIFWLNRVEGLTYREIQEQLGLTEGAVKAHMRTAIARTSRYRNAR